MPGTAADPDLDLVRHAQAAPARDTRAFEELVQRHQAFVVANCRFITRSAADADDLAQEVFVKAFFGLKRFEARSQFKTWLSRIKVNQCLNHLRRRHGQAVDVDDESIAAEPALQVAPVAAEDLEAADRQAAIAATLDELSDALRVPLILADADGLPYDEIAAQLGIGLSAVKMRIKRGREEFRRRYARRQADEGDRAASAGKGPS